MVARGWGWDGLNYKQHEGRKQEHDTVLILDCGDSYTILYRFPLNHTLEMGELYDI